MVEQVYGYIIYNPFNIDQVGWTNNWIGYYSNFGLIVHAMPVDNLLYAEFIPIAPSTFNHALHHGAPANFTGGVPSSAHIVRNLVENTVMNIDSHAIHNMIHMAELNQKRKEQVDEIAKNQDDATRKKLYTNLMYELVIEDGIFFGLTLLEAAFKG
ncbi:hypothetical protein [Methanobacterium sp.]|uniref:hypothetical protein n=1 Tax=Methanobacterium sp. TaxID=2164 RepID=UPI003158E915